MKIPSSRSENGLWHRDAFHFLTLPPIFSLPPPFFCHAPAVKDKGNFNRPPSGSDVKATGLSDKTDRKGSQDQ